MRFSFADSGVPEDEWSEKANLLSPYLSRLEEISRTGKYEQPESSICLPADGKIMENIRALGQKKLSGPLRLVIVVGIGGSSLGAKAVYDALAGRPASSSPKYARSQMTFLETTDELAVSSAARVAENLSSEEELLIIVISKFGRTLETMANIESLFGRLKRRFPNIPDRLVAVTDENSPLEVAARKRGLSVVNIPGAVGGRYSVFSAVGLLPLFLAGFDVEAFRGGALSARAAGLSEAADNPAIRGAIFLSYWLGQGKLVHDLFLFAPELESLGKWYRQLLSESIGKNETIGITPTVSVGSTDLHSLGQLYLGGPKDKTALLAAVESSAEEARVPADRLFPELIPALSGKSFAQVRGATYEAVKSAYRARGLPFAEVLFPRLNEYELGAFMQLKMIETMYLGELLGINAFDEPAVAAYKKEAVEILETL